MKALGDNNKNGQKEQDKQRLTVLGGSNEKDQMKIKPDCARRLV